MFEKEYCPECGDLLDRDCQGELRCPECDPPCPGCSDGDGPSMIMGGNKI